jgi:RNA polymerase sigma-70 factor (ECF subfamily)
LAFHQGRQVADELVSEVFVRAFARRATFDHRRGTARGWLYGIARNVSRERARQHVVEPVSLPTGHGGSGGTAGLGGVTAGGDIAFAAGGSSGLAQDPSDVVMARSLVLNALDRLSPERREVVLLVAGAGLTYEEAAAALDIPIGTVRSRFFRAKRQLAASLAGTTGSADTDVSVKEDPHHG